MDPRDELRITIKRLIERSPLPFQEGIIAELNRLVAETIGDKPVEQADVAAADQSVRQLIELAVGEATTQRLARVDVLAFRKALEILGPAWPLRR